jgi:cobaltochelatase CobT
VIAQLEAPESGIELCAIGIGHDVTRHYRRAVMVSEPEQLGGAVMGQLLALFDSPVQQKGRRA